MVARSDNFVTQSPRGRKAQLPSPDAAALAHSAALSAQIHSAVQAAGGWLSFADYMELALYAPGLGYYVAGQQRFGAAGDFVTAPEMGSVLGAVLARTLAPWAGRDGILEFGGGSGALAAQIHARLPALPYAMLEISPDLQARQRAACPAIRHLSGLPEAWDGVMLAHEVLDALPVHVIEKQADGRLGELGVTWRDGAWALAVGPSPLDDTLLGALGTAPEAWPTGYRTEICPRATAWLGTLASRLEQGAILLIDYGHEAPAYYHPQRHMGSLRAYYRHHWLDDPFLWPGLCDLTAHVNFSALMDEATAVGLHVHWYGNLARFLIEHGLSEVYPELLAQAGPHEALALNNEVKRLTLPQEMGESFKVLILTR